MPSGTLSLCAVAMKTKEPEQTIWQKQRPACGARQHHITQVYVLQSLVGEAFEETRLGYAPQNACPKIKALRALWDTRAILVDRHFAGTCRREVKGD